MRLTIDAERHLGVSMNHGRKARQHIRNPVCPNDMKTSCFKVGREQYQRTDDETQVCCNPHFLNFIIIMKSADIGGVGDNFKITCRMSWAHMGASQNIRSGRRSGAIPIPYPRSIPP